MKNNIFMTRQIAEDIAGDGGFHVEVLNAMIKFMDKDWGDLCDEDKSMNEKAVKSGGRILAAYTTSRGKVYIITDDTTAETLVTTILYADEY
jgi:hypothetical protein